MNALSCKPKLSLDQFLSILFRFKIIAIIILFKIERIQLKCRIVKEKMSICHVETNHVFLPSIRQDPLRRGVGLEQRL